MSQVSGGAGNDEGPRFLKDPPPGPDPGAARPVVKPAEKPMSSSSGPARPPLTAADLIAGMMADPALRAAGIRLESDDMVEPRRQQMRAAFAQAPAWEKRPGWKGAWVEQRLGGLRIQAPGHWRFQHDETGGAAWDIPGGALVTVMMVGFEKRAPSVSDYLAWQATTDRHGAERVGTRTIVHPHADAPPGTAMEMVEHAPHPLAWPQRWYRYASWTGTAIVMSKIDSDGLPGEDLIADVARLWRGLT